MKIKFYIPTIYLKNSDKIKFRVIEQAINEYDKTVSSAELGDQKTYTEELDKVTKTCGYQYRFVPTEGYGFDRERGFYNKSSKLLVPGSLDDYDVDENGLLWKKKKKPSKLENIAASIMIMLIITGLAFTSANLTGFSIFEFKEISSEIIGAGLFFLGIVGLLYLRKNQKKKMW